MKGDFVSYHFYDSLQLYIMKRIICIILCFILLTGCNNNLKQMEIPKDSSNLKVLSIDGINRFSQSNSYGYYEIANPMLLNNGVNIIFTDFQSMNKTYLCSSANCTHNGEHCNSFINGFTNNIFAVEDKIIFITYEENAEGVGFQRMYSSDVSGEDRRIIYEISANESFGMDYMADNKYIYFIISQQVDKATYQRILKKVNYTTGESFDLINLTQEYGNESNVNLYGVYNDNILLKKFSMTKSKDGIVGINHTITSIDTAGNPIKNFDDITYQINNINHIFDNNYMYTIDYVNNTFSRTNLFNGETINLTNTIPISFSSLNVGKTQIIDNKLLLGLVLITNNGISETRNEYTYLVNFDDSSIEEITLDFSYDGLTKDISPVAIYKDKLLVFYNILETEHFYKNPSKGIISDIIAQPQYAFISITDYFKSVPKYNKINYLF